MRGEGPMQLARWIAMMIITGCAAAGTPFVNGDDDDTPVDAPRAIDARQFIGDAPIPAIDAPAPLDAFVFLDAPPPPPDAASPFCTANSQCTAPGQCCITLGGPQGFCGDGIPIGSECFPQ